MLRTLAVQNYRSLRLVVPLTDLNVVTGPNGSGKSSLYRALRLLADAARNGAVAALASIAAQITQPEAARPPSCRHHPADRIGGSVRTAATSRGR